MASASEPSISLEDDRIEPKHSPKDNSNTQAVDHGSQEESQSSILELQEALGPLLLARKHKCTCLTQHRKIPFIPSHGCLDAREPLKPNWTGAFRLFSLPRELRDKIYLHYLHRPSDYTWTRYSRARNFAPKQRPADDVMSLLLTSRQVHAEAWDVFCRYSTVYLNRDPRDIYAKRLDDILRYFPYRPSRTLQCVGSVYWSNSTWGNENGAPDSFLQILRDAHEMKAQFPRLRIFSVRYGAHGPSDAEPLLVDCNWSEQRKIAKMLDWMRHVVAQSNIEPPAWVRWKLFGHWRQDEPFTERDQNSMGKAYGLLVRECSGRSACEDSGSKWIEETSRLGGRRRRQKP
ncbi:hypothetical protein IAQ61_000700 [Plenodomus lingam]|uniref:uncharacterized protein n=1 Tax=Leptosphaeria maculans TaxID=5022 RepID=UPI00331AB5FF|nr:hypothetical protein IAQ61_000700 [Plenodomus lingam]